MLFIPGSIARNAAIDNVDPCGYTDKVYEQIDYQNHPGKDLAHPVYIYGKVGCEFCGKAKAHLQELGISFSYASLELIPHEHRGAVVRDLKQRSGNKLFLPVLEFGDTWLFGYNRQRWEEALGL